MGNIDIMRDWGCAPEYVEAMWMMLKDPEPSDFVIATGKRSKLSDFVQEAFVCVGLNWEDHFEIAQDIFAQIN